MSKSPNLLIPGLGVTALVLGLGYGVGNRHYGADKIAMLEDRLGQVSAHEATARAEAADVASQAAEMEARIAEIQANAIARSSGAALTMPAPQPDGRLGLGRPAHAEEIAAWDVDIMPDGRGLPEGRGDALWGDEVFADYCAACHGDFAEGVDNWPVLAGGFDTLADKDPVKTVGSYWPHLSTVWDYVHRSMPFGGAQTLSDDEVYAIVAYILYSNDLVDEDFELSHENFAEFAMHNADGFIIDDRPETEYPEWRTDPCMQDCKDGVEITMRASVLDVTPAEEGDMQEVAAVEAPVASDATTPVAAVALDPALVKEGEKVFRKCKACHMVGDGAKNRVGPLLSGVMGRTFGGAEGFAYSGAFKAAADAGRVWDTDEMAAFLAKPKSYIEGTKMNFAGLKDEADIAAVIAYLSSFDE